MLSTKCHDRRPLALPRARCARCPTLKSPCCSERNDHATRRLSQTMGFGGFALAETIWVRLAGTAVQPGLSSGHERCSGTSVGSNVMRHLAFCTSSICGIAQTPVLGLRIPIFADPVIFPTVAEMSRKPQRRRDRAPLLQRNEHNKSAKSWQVPTDRRPGEPSTSRARVSLLKICSSRFATGRVVRAAGSRRTSSDAVRAQPR
jgi:hypothetical protein